MEVALQPVPVSCRGVVLAVLVELIAHVRGRDLVAVRHGRAELERGEDRSKLYQE